MRSVLCRRGGAIGTSVAALAHSRSKNSTVALKQSAAPAASAATSGTDIGTMPEPP